MNVSKTNTGKLLVAVLAMAMIVAGAAVVFSEESNATATIGTDSYNDFSEAVADIPKDGSNTVIKLTSNETVTGSVDLKGATVETNGYTLTINTSNTTLSNGKIVGDGKYVDIIISGSSLTNISLTGITFSNPGYYSIDVRDSTIVVEDCKFEGRASSAIYLELESSNVTVTDCEFNGSYSEGAISLDMGGTGASSTSKVTINSEKKMDVSVGSARGNITIGGSDANIVLGNNVSISDIYLDVNNKYSTGETASKVTVAGPLTINSIIGNGAVVNKSNLVISEPLPASIKYDKASTGTVEIDNATGLENTITGEFKIPNASYLVNSITIKEGASLTIQKYAYLDLMGETLTLEGTLTIDNDATVIDSVGGGSIVLSGKGVINNEGIIGAGNSVEISAVNGGSVTLKDISGIVFGTEKKTEGTVTYTLTVSGTIEAEAKTGSSIVFAEGVTIGADAQISRNVTASGAVTVKGGATLTLNGDATGLDVTMLNNSTVIANTSVRSIEAATGEYLTYDSTTGDRTDINDADLDDSTVALINVKGITVKVTSKIYDKPASDGSTKTVSYTEQMMSISGNLNLVNADTKAGTVQITGNVYVFTGETLSAGKTVDISNTSGYLITQGTVSVLVDAGSEPDILYKGAMYHVEPTDSDTYTYTYTNFTDALANIETAYDKTVTLMGGYEFTGNVTIAAEQTVLFEDADAEVLYTIASDATVIVQAEGQLSEEFATGTDKGIQGVLTVMDGGDCTPDVGSYEVMSTDADDNITYSSAQTAIKNATSGTVVDIVDGAILKDPVTIANGVTVNVNEGVNLQAQKGLTVAEGGKLVNKSTVAIADKYDLVIAGEVDSTEGTISAAGADSEISVTGTLTVPAKIQTNNVNAAVYADDGNYVYTSVAKAVAAVSEMDIPVDIEAVGTFSESGTVTLGQDMEIIVTGNPITLGTIVLEAGSKLTVNDGSLLSATVSGVTGADGASTDASVVLSKASNIAFTETYNSSNTTSSLNIAAVDDTDKAIVGNISVDAGNVSVIGQISFDGKIGTLTIGANGTVTVPESAKVTAEDNTDKNPAIIIDGTMNVDEGTFTISTDAFASVAGTIDISGSSAQTGVDVTGTLTVTGTITVSDVQDDVGLLKISGILIIGDKPEAIGTSVSGSVTGPVDLDGNGYIKAYGDADLSNAAIELNEASQESDAKSTVFNVNGGVYMTVYALDGTISGTNGLGVLTTEDFNLVGYVTKEGSVNINEITQWYTDAELTKKATNIAAIGNPEALYFKADADTIRVEISVGTGISLYIDGIKQEGSFNYFKVGTHTVSATVNPGYSGDATITFNGQTVTGGQFTITPEMASATYTDAIVVSATGEISIDGGSSSDGMGLTEILLVILVILIVVMAIMVALRLMRS